jgi:hypothetical protein
LGIIWEPELTTVYDANDYVTISWTPYGKLEKTLHVIVDEVWHYSKNIGITSGIEQPYTIPNKLAHGAHTVTLYLEADYNNEPLPTQPITHEIIVADRTDT